MTLHSSPEFCRFPDCNCPMDPGPEVDWCARGLPHDRGTAHSSPSGSERGGNADAEVRASLSDHAVLSEDLPPARPTEHCACAACVGGVLHYSSCAVHNKGVPELYGPCDCTLPKERMDALVKALSLYTYIGEMTSADGLVKTRDGGRRARETLAALGISPTHFLDLFA